MFECRVYYGPKASQHRIASSEELVLTGGVDEETGMWKLPINPVTKSSTLAGLDLPANDFKKAATPGPICHGANTLYTLPHKQQQMKYMHQCFFSPPIQTITRAANKGHLDGIPLLSKPSLIRKYLAPSPATSKGRLKKQRANVRSTRRARVTVETIPEQLED